MKVLVALLLFVAVTASYKITNERVKRFFLGYCDVDSDCGVDRCCSFLGTCHDKRGLDESCNALTGSCGCKEGLSCQPVFHIGSINPFVYYRCRPIPTDAPGSGDVYYLEE